MPIRALAQSSARTPLALVDLPDPAPPGPREVDVEVTHCSVCHSDVHLLDGDWGDVARPLVPGHEIIGRVLACGSDTAIEKGRLVGIGWQAGACGKCFACTTGRVHLCTGGKKRTCMGRQGGFATRVRVDADFVFDIPAGLDPATAAPLLCAGLTVFSPLTRLGAGTGVRVGVVGIGGLGHLAVRFAKALGSEVIAFDPDASKKELARTLGASELVDARGALPSGAVDLLLVTTHANLDWDAWLKVLALEGTLCLIGIPSQPLRIGVDPLTDEQKRVTGSVIGSPDSMRKMLAMAAQHGIAPITERLPMSRANDAVARVRSGEARLRVVLDRDFD